MSVKSQEELQKFLAWVHAIYGPEVSGECARKASLIGRDRRIIPFALLDEALREFEQEDELAAHQVGELGFNS